MFVRIALLNGNQKDGATGCVYLNQKNKGAWPEFNKDICFSLLKYGCRHPHTYVFGP